MASTYNTEPPPTATVLLHTTAGPITLSLFAAQTPLTCRNFLQHLIDGYYDNTPFHRVVPGFVIQGGDPTGTGEGGENIYDEDEEEFGRLNAPWAKVLRKEVGERVVLGDEVHGRLRFNRRGLVGMAKDGMGGYGSQWFVTLGDARAELDGRMTMFGRVEGEGIYNVMKIAEGEVVEGSERPVYPVRVERGEVLAWPKGEAWEGMRARVRVERRVVEEEKGKEGKGKKKKGKAGKVMLSFADEGEEEVVVRPGKAKFNTKLFAGEEVEGEGVKATANGRPKTKLAPVPEAAQEVAGPPPPAKTSTTVHRKRKSPSPDPTPIPLHSPEPPSKRRKPSFHDTTTQLPLRDEESPSRSPTPEVQPSKQSALDAEIAALKVSMRRDVAVVPEKAKKKSALEELIPETSIKGRKRPRPGEGGTGDAATLKMLNAFKARLDGVVREDGGSTNRRAVKANGKINSDEAAAKDGDEAEEAALCDLHFIANCRSCRNWDQNDAHGNHDLSDDDGKEWMAHALSFEKDRLGKDLTWKRKTEEELVVIDPREKERAIKAEVRMERERRMKVKNG